MKGLVFRADGSSEIGMGHIYRCLALSEMLAGSFKMAFAIFEPDQKTQELIRQFKLPVLTVVDKLSVSFADGFDLIVLDGYWYQADFIKTLKTANKKVVEIDDIPKAVYFSDLVINHAMGADYSSSIFPERTKLLSGPEYVILRKEFSKKVERSRVFAAPDVIAINMGGADPHNYSIRILKALYGLKNIKIEKIHILTGSAYQYKQQLSELIAENAALKAIIHSEKSAEEIRLLFDESALLFCSASTIAYEACAVGVPMVVFLTAQNQINLYKGLLKANVCEDGGELAELNQNELAERISSLLTNYSSISKKESNQIRMIDGKSGERICKEIISLCA